MTKLHKFTALDKTQIKKIVSNIPPHLYHIAKTSRDLILGRPEYQKLIEDFHKSADKKKFIEDNVKQIASFLNEAGLAGYLGEKDDFTEKPVGIGDFLITSDGAGLILSYLHSKPQNSKAHEMQSVRNTNLVTTDKSRKPATIFIEQKGVLDNFRKQVTDDLKKAGTGDFSKTYLVEIFGTNGGDHIASVTIHKRAGENDPIVHLFDSSPAIIRNGFEAATNSVANGWCTQLFVNATLKKAFAECGLTFKNENYFNNSEPLQKPGSSYCTSFATEMAVKIAGLDREAHIAMLKKKYKYPSLYGGMTEIAIDADQIKKTNYALEPELALDADEVFLSHFTTTALKSRIDELAKVEHIKKGGLKETVLQRVARYQLQADEMHDVKQKDGTFKQEVKTPASTNQMIEQKVGRQKWGHLFEIATSEEFLDKADEAVMPKPLDIARGTPYFPKFNENEKPQTKEDENLVEAFNKFMPRFNRINKVKFDKEKNELTVTVYLSKITNAKLESFMREQKIETRTQEIDFSDYLVGTHHDVSKFCKVEVIIPKDRYADLSVAMEKKESLVKVGDHAFMPQTSARPITANEFVQNPQQIF